MRIKHVTGLGFWDQALSWESSDNQGAAKPVFLMARPDSDKGNQNDESKSSFQMRNKFIKIIPEIISKGYLLIGEFIIFSTRRDSYDLMSLLINTEARQKRFLLRSVG